jgi:predicted nucleic acid-binding protein
MNCYLDSSVVLRILFGESNPLKEWKQIKRGFSSRLLRLECLRTVDRIKIQQALPPKETADLLVALRTMLSHIGTLPITSTILERAEQPFLTPLGTLDAIHLTTAILWQETREQDFLLATHDDQLATACRAHGIKVIGI